MRSAPAFREVKPGKDIALFGGGELFRSLLTAGLVDEIGVAMMPVLFGGGIPSFHLRLFGRHSGCESSVCTTVRGCVATMAGGGW